MKIDLDEAQVLRVILSLQAIAIEKSAKTRTRMVDLIEWQDSQVIAKQRTAWRVARVAAAHKSTDTGA